MQVVRCHDAAEFLERAGDLLADQARHNLILGICSALENKPGLYPQFHLWVAEEDSRPVGAAVMTPPHNMVVAPPRSEQAIPALARSVRDEGVPVPGVSAPLPESERFAEAWRSLTGQGFQQRMSQRIYRLTSVRDVPPVPGALRVAVEADRELVVRWWRAFAEEALPPGAPGSDPERLVGLRLPAGEIFLWDDVGPASVSGWSHATDEAARIGPVYTPPELRKKGYATALVAAQSAELLGRGKRFCFLYTDLANPTSNKIYMNIGYEPVCDAAEFVFASADDQG